MKSRCTPKHAQLYAALSRDIRLGKRAPGARLPSEAQLTRRFGVSRITVSRAMRDLQSAGLIERRAGSGSYVRAMPGTGAHSFGVLIPDRAETEIFDPVCRGMMESPLAGQHALLWGNSGAGNRSGSTELSSGARAWHLCRQYIERKVAGVFFAPLEHLTDKDELNRNIGRAFDCARIPVVLLDRPMQPFPAVPSHDLVGIDNRRAGYAVTQHLLGLGCRRIHFVAMENAASTVDDRQAGYREALYASGIAFDPLFVHRFDPGDIARVSALMSSGDPDGIVCANDRTAGSLMHSLRRLDYRVPADIRLVGFDDVEYARLLPVPLTTMRQPAKQIGDIALALMLERIARPDLPVRDTRLHGELVIRESCGAAQP